MIDSHADKYPNMALHLHSHPGQLTTQSGQVTHVITTHIVLTLVCLLGHIKPPKYPPKYPPQHSPNHPPNTRQNPPRTPRMKGSGTSLLNRPSRRQHTHQNPNGGMKKLTPVFLIKGGHERDHSPVVRKNPTKRRRCDCANADFGLSHT